MHIRTICIFVYISLNIIYLLRLFIVLLDRYYVTIMSIILIYLIIMFLSNIIENVLVECDKF